MKLVVKGMLIGLAVLPLSAGASSPAGEKAVKYQGAGAAVSVCKSVVADDPERLRQLLHQHRSAMVASYRYDLNSPAVAGSYTCNDMELAAFADEVGADDIASFLNKGYVEMEEIYSSAQ